MEHSSPLQWLFPEAAWGSAMSYMYNALYNRGPW